MNAVESYHRLSITLFGDAKNFTPANRSVNAISILTMLICFVLIPFNIYFGLYPIVIMLASIIVMLTGLYYLSRVKKLVLLPSVLYGVGGYITIVITYLYNDGINGPAILLFFLSFSLLIGFTSKKLHKYWLVFHLLIGAGLLTAEYFYPSIISDSYQKRSDRYADMLSSYCVALFFMYLIIYYLRRAYSTERKLVLKRSKELEDSNDQKTKLFSIVAHDLKTPLNGLLGYLELLNAYGIPEEQKRIVEKQLLTSTRQTAELLTNLLLWSKAQMDGIQPHLSDLQLKSTLQSTVLSLSETAAAKNVNLHFHLDTAIVVKADREMLLLVVRNLVHNAIKFTPAKGTVVISGEIHDDFIRLLIIDNGIGVPENQRTDLFTVKTKPSFGTNKEKGFGLGLLLCKEFTEMQGGRIGYMSMEQKGSKFYIELPLVYDLSLKAKTPARSVFSND